MKQHRQQSFALLSWAVSLGLLLSLNLVLAHAADQGIAIVRVTIIAPPCEINGNGLIEVPFGEDVMTTKVDGNYKKRQVPYSLECKEGSPKMMKMWVGGTGAVFDSRVLSTNRTDLGIALLSGGNPLPINSWVNFTYPNYPRLEAVPVKRSGAKLTAGPFSAGATMKVEYQ